MHDRAFGAGLSDHERRRRRRRAPPRRRPPDNIEPVKDLLDAHVPLTLLVDLLTDAAPPSAEILESEGLPDTPWWEQDTPPGPGRPASRRRDGRHCGPFWFACRAPGLLTFSTARH